MNEPVALSNRRTFSILLGIVLLGAALRFYNIGFQSLWYDELHSIISTAPENSLSYIIEYCKTDQPPAFFIYLHYFFKLFGYGETSGRIASALIGVVSILVCYWLGRECGGKETGLMAALIVTINYFHIYYSQELRFYTMTFLFSALSYLFFIRAFKFSYIRDFIGYTIATALLLYTHYYGLVVFATQAITFIVLLIFYKRDLKFILGGVLSAGMVVVLFIPWIPTILSDLGISSFWIKKPSPFFVLDYFYNYTGKDVATTLILVVLLVLFFRNWKMTDEYQKPLLVIILTWLALSYLIPYVKSVAGVPILHIRYTIIALPAWVIIFSMGWESIKKLRLKYAVVILLTLAAFLNLFFFRKFYTKITKQQVREVTQMVKMANSSHHPVYSNYEWHFNFYFRDQPQKVVWLSKTTVPDVDNFWVLQMELLSPEERYQGLEHLLTDFEVSETHLFKGTSAVFLKRKHN